MPLDIRIRKGRDRALISAISDLGYKWISKNMAVAFAGQKEIVVRAEFVDELVQLMEEGKVGVEVI